MSQHCIRVYATHNDTGQAALKNLNDYLSNGYIVISAIPVVRQSLDRSSYIEYIVEKKGGK